MRTPALIARALGWPEARHHAPDRYGAICGKGDCKWATHDHLNPDVMMRVLEDHIRTEHGYRPRLRIRRAKPGLWSWEMLPNTDGPYVYEPEPFGFAPSQPAALALGLAALDTTRSHR